MTKLSNLNLFFKHFNAQCVPTGDSSGDLITSNRADSTAMERSNVTLSCNHISATILQWYHQQSGSTPTFLMTVYSDEDQKYEKDGRISVRLNKEKTQVFLDISSTRVSDSALYYCALQPTVTEHPAALYKNICSSATAANPFSMDASQVCTLCFNSTFNGFMMLSLTLDELKIF